ncbi:hypothetical protein [Amycolatopsis aidingensis]|uniref:hypothetical protein n=1 Tax=Amycolatopsis aidingensis TaxID=2842453 RepID=UPI001C0DFF69|nr:hypothetical protein [Amycolatopsis aidingensis]
MITGNLIMHGANTTIARAGRASRFRVMEIAEGGSRALHGSTISGGYTTDGERPGEPSQDGGGIRNAGSSSCTAVW